MSARELPGGEEPFKVEYNFHGRRYSSGIHDDAVVVHMHGAGSDLTNQQNCVVTLSNGAWMICWTQATEEAAKDESVVGATSLDGGLTWTEPYAIERAVDERTASWGMLFAVPHTARVYCFYWYNENAIWLRDAGTMYFRFSDDLGRTWSGRHRIELPRHALDVDGEDQHGWNTGFPILTRDGAMLLGFSKIHPPSMTRDIPGHFYGDPDLWWSECFFLRCPNILSTDDPEKLEFTVTPEGPRGLSAPHADEPDRPFAQEPYMAVLPSGRVLATMRTRTGHPYYSISSDHGVTWTPARPLRFAPGGEKMKHPCGPCQVTCARDGRIIFFFRNDNAPLGEGHLCYWANRDPIHCTVGIEMPDYRPTLDPDEDNAGLYFDKPRVILSGVKLDSNEVQPNRKAEYPQLIQWGDRFFVIYSSQKTDILIKEIPAEMFAGRGLPL